MNDAENRHEPDTLTAVSETAVLQRLFPRLPAADGALIGPGDDAAVLAAPDGRFVVTTDMMIHGPDFRLAWSSPFELGWKAAATNLSDVAAMGATPTALVVAIAAPGDTEVTTSRESRMDSGRRVSPSRPAAASSAATCPSPRP